MLLGEILYTSADAVYTPIVNRIGNTMLFSVEVTQYSGTTPSLAITIQHKNRDDSSWTDVSMTALTANGISSKVVEGIRELVRLKFVMSGTSAWMRVFTYEPIAQ